MLTETQFKGLYTGRLAYVDHPYAVGTQMFGVVCLTFKTELFAEQRVRLLSMLEKAAKDGASFSYILEFPNDVEFSSVDMDMLKELYIKSLEWKNQLQVVCGTTARQKLSSNPRTTNIKTSSSFTSSLLKVSPKFLVPYGQKMTRNIFVMEQDQAQRESLINSMLIDRFSAVEILTDEMASKYILHFGKFIDGAIFEFRYPEYKEEIHVKNLMEQNPEAKVLIHSAVLDARLLQICQQYKVSSVVKSPYKVQNLLFKYKNEFPERSENYLGFKE